MEGMDRIENYDLLERWCKANGYGLKTDDGFHIKHNNKCVHCIDVIIKWCPILKRWDICLIGKMSYVTHCDTINVDVNEENKLKLNLFSKSPLSCSVIFLRPGGD